MKEPRHVFRESRAETAPAQAPRNANNENANLQSNSAGQSRKTAKQLKGLKTELENEKNERGVLRRSNKLCGFSSLGPFIFRVLFQSHYADTI